jgi:hypothetical protein
MYLHACAELDCMVALKSEIDSPCWLFSMPDFFALGAGAQTPVGFYLMAQASLADLFLFLCAVILFTEWPLQVALWESNSSPDSK